jgi:hypothetical protein
MQEVPPMGKCRSNFAAILSNDGQYVLVFGSGTGEERKDNFSLEIYSIELNRWTMINLTAKTTSSFHAPPSYDSFALLHSPNGQYILLANPNLKKNSGEMPCEVFSIKTSNGCSPHTLDVKIDRP